jgi:hypothetical protein
VRNPQSPYADSPTGPRPALPVVAGDPRPRNSHDGPDFPFRSIGLNNAAVSRRLEDARFPLIVRPICSHAGRGLAKLDAPPDIAAYLAGRPESEFFISRFVDYSSPDGLFRKYRLVCVDGRPYACHMAISAQWNIWYLNADMAEVRPSAPRKRISWRPSTTNSLRVMPGRSGK